MIKYLVTGSAGFIGFHLIERLLKDEECEIVGLDNINDYYDVNLKYARLKESGIPKEKIDYNTFVVSEKNKRYRFIRLNLEDKKNILQLFESEKIDFVIHLAAQAGVRYSLINPESYIQSNIVGFLNILEGCKQEKIKHLVYASSSSVYGLNTKAPFSTSDNVDHPVSLYAATKKANELMAHTYSYLYNVPTTGLRFFTVYGPWGRPDMALFKFTKAILNGDPIDVYNNGNMIRDFTYIDDIIEGICKVINHIPRPKETMDNDPSTSIAPYKIYNIGNSSPVALMDFISAIEKELGKTARKNYLPLQPGDVMMTNSDVSDLEKDLGYKPSTKLEDGVHKFVEWYLDYMAQ
jgi:UDP-glucuronate 4-epimerase